MFYQNLKFPRVKDRPFFYTNFVATVDGKTQVLKNTADYWPIGSKKDHDVLMQLRANADCLIHGSKLALEFGNITLDSLMGRELKTLRKKLKKAEQLPYYVITNHPTKLTTLLSEAVIVNTDLRSLVKDLHTKGYKNVLVEGGPTLLGSFLELNLIDQIFLTIAPKIFGSEKDSTLTLVEGHLFSKENIKNLKLLSVKQVEDEIYLRYEVKK